MTYEEIMSIGAGEVVPGGYSVAINATYIGPGEKLLNKDGSVAPGGHAISKWDKIVVLDISYSTQLALIQYPAGGQIRQGYIHNSLSHIEYKNLEQNFWQNGSTPETVYYSYTGDASYPTPIPAHDKAIFLYKVEDRYNVAYWTNKGAYTCAGFVNYSGGITPAVTNGRRVAGGNSLSGDFWLNNIAPGEVVPGGRSFSVNAIAEVDLDVRDAKGNSLQGREVNKGDELTVLDVGYTRQLALVQYPAGGQIRQGYITNNAKYISYKNPDNWYNGKTQEEVLNHDGSHLGWLSAHETATILYKTNGLIQVVYSTDKGVNTKSGFVKYPGTARDIVHRDIPNPNVMNAEIIQYGTSGKGRTLRAYKMGNGKNTFIFNCAIHGWEDHWAADGIELTKIGNQIIEHFQNNSTGDFTLYVIPVANPDGVSEGWTNDGPGRCTIVGAIDCNRDFPVGFTPGGVPRHYTGAEALSVPESRELASFIKGIKNSTSGETFLIDMHGWEGSSIGSSRIGQHFVGKLGLEPKYRFANQGYLIDWANSIGITSALIELPSSIYSHADVVNLNCAGKIIQGLTEIMGASAGSNVGNYNGHINSGVEYVNVRTEPNTASASTILGKLYGNNKIQILAKVKPYGDSYYWYKIVFIKDGEKLQAYVREDFVTVTGEIPKDDIPSGGGEPGNLIPYDSVGQVNNKAASVHVRKGAGTGAGCDIVTSVNSGELLMIIGKTQPGGETLPWYEINFNGQELYIRSDFVDIVSETKLDEQGSINSSTGWVHLRSLPGTGDECKIITTLNNGDWVEIFGELQPKGESIPWYRLRWQAGIGFVRSDFITINGKGVTTGKYGNVTLSNVLDYIFFGVETEVTSYNLAHSNALDEKIKALTVAPIFEVGPFTVTLECQIEDDVKIPDGNQLQFLDGNLAGVIIKKEVDNPNNIFAKKFGKDFIQKLNTEYGMVGNGTYFDIQKLLTLYNSGTNVGDADVVLDFEFAWREENEKKAPIIMITGELQRIIGTSKGATKYLNALIKIEIDLGKLNIDPASYLFTHNISQYLIDKRISLNNIMDNADKAKFINTQNPEKLYEMIKTLCYTFLQVGSTQIILEMKEINQNEVVSTLENLLEGKTIDINTVGKALIIGGTTAGTLYVLNRALIVLAALVLA